MPIRLLGMRVAFGVALLTAVSMSPLPAPAGEAPSCGGLLATIVGTSGADELIGTPGVDVIVGRAGDDLIRGKGGGDIICGGAGHDVILGGAGADTIRGGAAADELRGGAGTDSITGGRGFDLLEGGHRRDELTGGGGDDRLRGGSARDTCLGGAGFNEMWCEAYPGSSKVRIEGFAYLPDGPTVPTGTTIVWRNLDFDFHTATSDDGLWDSSDLAQGDSYGVTLDEAGTYEYFCYFHPFMVAEIDVSG